VGFLTQTLKPYVDRHFRTLPQRQHTGIGGSSMGGLISIYAGLMHPEVYSKLMIFSPSLWVTPNIRFRFMNLDAPDDMHIYLYAGENEGANMVKNIRELQQVIEEQNRGKPKAQLKFKLEIDPAGTHNEARWGREFPHALRWLYFGETTKGGH
jgi:predicted alpha/beta superfamily hydrolase